MDKIRIGIVGYGNIGRGVELAVARNQDMELKAVFTRRDPSTVKILTEGAAVQHMDEKMCIRDRMMVMTGRVRPMPVRAWVEVWGRCPI